jgi:hypothetical protein
MSSKTSSVSAEEDSFWWQGGLMEIKARAGDTGGAFGVLEGQIRFGVGDDEFVAGPGAWVWQPRGVPHSFKVESDYARALVIFTPGGIERMFEEGGESAGASAEPPPQREYDLEASVALAKKFGFEVVGAQVGNASP